MKIEISGIPQEGIRLSRDYNSQELDLNSSDVEIKKPLHAEVYCYKISNTVSLEIDLEAEYNLKCSRCLEIVPTPLKRKMKFSYLVKPTDTFVDATDDLRGEIILNYPMKPLCRGDCKGLCPKCGKNLNEGKCDCK